MFNATIAKINKAGAIFDTILGDKHLLRLKSHKDIPILAPQQFLNQIKPR